MADGRWSACCSRSPAPFTLLSLVLSLAVSEWFLLLTAFVGVNQWLYVAVGACPASTVLRHACRLRSAMYENETASPVDAKAVRI
jgi:hypothetical protein